MTARVTRLQAADALLPSGLSEHCEHVSVRDASTTRDTPDCPAMAQTLAGSTVFDSGLSFSFCSLACHLKKKKMKKNTTQLWRMLLSYGKWRLESQKRVTEVKGVLCSCIFSCVCVCMSVCVSFGVSPCVCSLHKKSTVLSHMTDLNLPISKCF